MALSKLDLAFQQAKTRKAIIERLKRVLINRLKLPLEIDEVADDSPLFGSGLGLDSVDALEIVVVVEKEFGVSITDDDMQAFRSINTIVDFIIAKQAEQKEEQ